jgi:hypothetical protein
MGGRNISDCYIISCIYLFILIFAQKDVSGKKKKYNVRE